MSEIIWRTIALVLFCIGVAAMGAGYLIIDSMVTFGTDSAYHAVPYIVVVSIIAVGGIAFSSGTMILINVRRIA